MASRNQITTMQALQKAERLGYVAKLSPDGSFIVFYTGDTLIGRAKIREGCVDAVTVSLLIGTEG